MVIENPIQFKISNKLRLGYPAVILPDICIAVLEARKQGILQAQQYHIADRCEILVPSLMKIGVVALVDDAVGFAKEQFEF